MTTKPSNPPKPEKAAEPQSVIDRLKAAGIKVVEAPEQTFVITGEQVHEMWREAKSRAKDKSDD